MTQPRPFLRFGYTDVRDGIISVQIKSEIRLLPTAVVTLSFEALQNISLEWQSQVQVLVEHDGTPTPRFTGVVDKVTPGQDRIVLNLVSVGKVLEEMRIGGLGSRASNLERIWALARTSGFDDSQISIEGFAPRPIELFEVATPLDGLTISEAQQVGDVHLLGSGPVTELAGDLGPDSLRERYRSTETWAYTTCAAGTLLDAERKGLALIDLAIAWLVLVSQVSSIGLPGSAPRMFHRDWTIARVSRRDVVVVRGLATQRHWLRAPTDLMSRPDLQLSEMPDFHLFMLPPSISPQMKEALLAWRRAMEEEDRLTTVMSLWEAIEFYASGIVVPPLFEKRELRALARRATEGIEDVKRQRIMELVGRINEPPLLTKLRTALSEDQVPYTEEEFELLSKVRRIRNDFVHGRSRSLPSDTDLRLVVAFVNRMLVHRMDRLSRRASPSTLVTDGMQL